MVLYTSVYLILGLKYLIESGYRLRHTDLPIESAMFLLKIWLKLQAYGQRI